MRRRPHHELQTQKPYLSLCDPPLAPYVFETRAACWRYKKKQSLGTARDTARQSREGKGCDKRDRLRRPESRLDSQEDASDLTRDKPDTDPARDRQGVGSDVKREAGGGNPSEGETVT
ncbi:hypothetical protein NDU88_010941 [Pleurodeles waltl]|uniref:Uncharacterized protein n=1 Tax=Pleurodeles waltl TaxID=8319 RepID=A0AAV7Q0C8_PLEWA|nr:hypothetical protein NDU88_010941 [Pleurodeles waltl]